MRELIQQNREELLHLLQRIEVGDHLNKMIDFEGGVEQCIELINEMCECEGKLIWIGNGGSAAIASHMATDFLKNLNIPAMAFSDPSLLTCISNDLGYDQVYAKPLELLGKSEDILIAISSSGSSRNILNAVETASRKNMKIITLSGFKPDNSLRQLGVINFYVPSEHYGHVEDIHHSICHCLIDIIMQHHVDVAKGKEKIHGTI